MARAGSPRTRPGARRGRSRHNRCWRRRRSRRRRPAARHHAEARRRRGRPARRDWHNPARRRLRPGRPCPPAPRRAHGSGRARSQSHSRAFRQRSSCPFSANPDLRFARTRERETPYAMFERSILPGTGRGGFVSRVVEGAPREFRPRHAPSTTRSMLMVPLSPTRGGVVTPVPLPSAQTGSSSPPRSSACCR